MIWSQLKEENFRGQPLGYKIIYFPDDLERDINFVNVNVALNNTTLTNLTAYTMYVINVAAVSFGGIGPAKKAMARTGAEGTIKSFPSQPIPWRAKSMKTHPGLCLPFLKILAERFYTWQGEGGQRALS